MSFTISPSPRVRRSPFFDATVADGAVGMTTYNHMLMPTGYGDPMAEYWRLIEGVAMWDVAVERQVELNGPDAGRLAQILCPRKLDRLKPGVGWYVPLCDHRGTIINDPIILKLNETRYWLSIADSDVLFWARAIGAERGLDVDVFEPDVSPLAIQGPKADDVVAILLGEDARKIRHFHFEEHDLDGIPLMVARSGWSKQGGFELYLMDGAKGDALWQRVKDAGAPFGIGPGTPNTMERIESGLLSWGGDTDDDTNPFEIGLGKYVHLDAPDEVVSIAALRRIAAEGVKRRLFGVKIENDEPLTTIDRWSDVFSGDTHIGHVTAHTYSPRLQMSIGHALVARDADPGDLVVIRLADGREAGGELCELPFL